MPCKIELSKSAEKFLRKAPKDLVERVNERLRELSDNPICEARLKGSLRDLCKSHIGDIRIAYILKPCTITIVEIGYRGKFYDKLGKHD